MIDVADKVRTVIAIATEGARIALLKRRNADEGLTCFTVGISGGCGNNCPVLLAGDCELGQENAA